MHVAIVGGGLAGFSCAQEVRRGDPQARITIVDPQGAPYDRPPLSKEYLTGEMPRDKVFFHDEQWFAEQRIALVTDAVTRLDLAGLTVELDGGESLTADRVVLATGGRARQLPIRGGDLAGLLSLRTLDDADRLRAALVPGRRLAIVGAGLVGAEVASTAVASGVEVTLVDPVETPLLAAAGALVAGRLHAMHAAHGVRVIRAAIERIEALPPTSPRLDPRSPSLSRGYRLRLSDGSTLAADDVLLAVGLVPDDGLAREAGLECEDGILVDQAQRTSHPHVLAVGDVTRRRAGGTPGIRHEHWEAAMRSGQTAAAALLGTDLPNHGASWWWSDRYGVHAEGLGDLGVGISVVRELGDGAVVDFRLADEGRLLGAAAIDAPRVIRAARRLMDAGIPVTAEDLADPSVDLRKLGR